VSGQVIGGREADPALWPATFVFRNSLGAGCTATAVSGRVILLAAHCIANGSSGVVTLRGQDIPLTCEYHPNYPADISADFALCLTQGFLNTPSGGFETLEPEPLRPAQNESVVLLGYGCLTVGGADHNFGVLYSGDARISDVRDKTGFIQTQGGAAVCFGDSGGGAYYYKNASGTLRRLFAVNARGNIAQISYLARTASPTFTIWARDWAARQGVELCGLHASTLNCRQ
jgi:hypothetical protein